MANPLLAVWLSEAPQPLFEVMKAVFNEIVFNRYPAYKRICQRIYVRVTNYAATEKIPNLSVQDLNDSSGGPVFHAWDQMRILHVLVLLNQLYLIQLMIIENTNFLQQLEFHQGLHDMGANAPAGNLDFLSVTVNNYFLMIRGNTFLSKRATCLLLHVINITGKYNDTSSRLSSSNSSMRVALDFLSQHFGVTRKEQTKCTFLPFDPTDKRTTLTYIDGAGKMHIVSKRCTRAALPADKLNQKADGFAGVFPAQV
ncbi:DNA replication licensing factor Mcm2 [Artemisia annua]|uniref:DNA replication licensing factor Mcm2 n=1 Tax=Artemisia annua TaxID=35608 RepID=A0A2U1MAJ6_ARTAN|nr:DNA replication licensing factor Mcm2 [Artemisia annua]